MYSERLANLEELIQRCRTEQAKDYISEAINCYRTGAYRAAIVNTWIAVVFDLIDKTRELSISGNGDAKNIIDDFEKFQQQIDDGNKQAINTSLAFERNILETSKTKLQFFDEQQMVDLKRLREDRHRCAHPSFNRIEDPYKPSAEQARLHIRNAIFHVLSQAPVQGRSAIAQVESLVSSEYFPTKTEDAIIQIKASVLNRGTDALIKGVIDRLIIGICTEGDVFHRKLRAVSALRAIMIEHRTVAEDRIITIGKKMLDMATDPQLGAPVGLALSMPEVWTSLSSAQQDKIIQYIKVSESDATTSLLVLASKHPELEKVLTDKINNFDEDNLIKVIQNAELRNYAIEPAVSAYSNVYSWDSANRVYKNLIEPLVGLLSKEQAEEIIRSPRENGSDLLGSTEFSSFLRKLIEQDNITLEEIKDLLDAEDMSIMKKYIEESEDDE